MLCNCILSYWSIQEVTCLHHKSARLVEYAAEMPSIMKVQRCTQPDDLLISRLPCACLAVGFRFM